MSKFRLSITAILIALFLVTGCSGGGGNPVSPGSDPQTPARAAPASGSQTCLWGLWDVYIDVENETVEAVLNRQGMFTANLVGVLNSMPSTLSFSFNGVTPEPDYIDVDLDLSITHPFAGKPKFDGYDVRGVFMGNGSASMLYNSDLNYPVPGTDQMMLADPGDGFGGPDGYTRWFNRTEFSEGGMPLFQYTQGIYASKDFEGDATLCPYKYFADDLEWTDNLWDFLTMTVWNGRFVSGSTNTRNYYIRFPNATGLKFGYAVIANWGGGTPGDHPSNAPEAVGCDVLDESNVWYVDPSSNGGSLKLDISLFTWEGQPSAIFIESSVLASTYEFDAMDMTPVGGMGHYSTYHVEIAADNVTGVEDQEFWVIAEVGDCDYTNEFGVPNLADTDPLAAFFRYELEVAEESTCPAPEVTGVDPNSGKTGDNVDDVQINCFEIEAGVCLSAYLSMDGQPSVAGTDITYVDNSGMTADFDLSGVSAGLWDVVVINGCCSLPGIGEDLFEVIEYSGPILRDSGPLPTPHPVTDFVDFCVVGDDWAGKAGVYYHYYTDPDFQIYTYPLDYSSPGALYCNLSDPFFGDIPGLLIGPEWMSVIETTTAGVCMFTSESTDPMTWGSYPANSAIWWCGPDGVIDNGWMLFELEFADLENDFSLTGRIWGYWGECLPGAEYGPMFYFGPPYQDDSYGYFDNYYPLDTIGSVDGEVSDNEAYKLALDSEPVGLEDPHNIIHYWMEGPPDDPGIEIIKNSNIESQPESIATIDEDLMGTPVDITCVNSFGVIPWALGNWLVVLEDNGDSRWQIAVFDQNGNLIDRVLPALDGDALAMDADYASREIHVWYDNGGYEYAIFGWD